MTKHNNTTPDVYTPLTFQEELDLYRLAHIMKLDFRQSRAQWRMKERGKELRRAGVLKHEWLLDEQYSDAYREAGLMRFEMERWETLTYEELSELARLEGKFEQWEDNDDEGMD